MPTADAPPAAGGGGAPTASPAACPPAAERAYTIPELTPERRRLVNAASGRDDLLRRLESALAARDAEALEALLVNAGEYRDILYPSFPAAHPPIEASFETVWVLHVGDTMRGLRELLREYGGREVRILDVRFERPAQDCVNFVLDETSRVDVAVDGERRENVRLFGSVVRIGNQVKLLSYPDDPG